MADGGGLFTIRRRVREANITHHFANNRSTIYCSMCKYYMCRCVLLHCVSRVTSIQFVHPINVDRELVIF